jgi:inner membrane protein
MDPVTHALASAALDRAGLRALSPLAMLILVVSGTAADLDLLSYFGGPSGYFHYHFAMLHSILGSTALAVAIAIGFCVWARGPRGERLRFARVLLLCVIGAGVHLLLDCLGADGVQLFWPFRQRWFALDLLPQIDPWILAALIIGLLLPALFRLVSEEIGERKKQKTVSKGAVAALIVMALYIGERALLHQRAMEALMSHDYHGAAPLAAGAFPDSPSPFLWRGVVETANTIEQVDVPLGPGDEFRADTSLTVYKPEDSLALDVARRALLAKEFLAYARFPLAELQSIPNGSLVTIRDFRFAPESDAAGNLRAVIELDGQLHVRSEELEFASQSGK